MAGTGESKKAYQVLRIDELTRMSDNRGVERYYRHRIKTRGGTILTVDINEGDFNEAAVAPILEKRATDADRILNL